MGIDTARIIEIKKLELELECECGQKFTANEKEGGTICPGCFKDIDVGIFIKGRYWNTLRKCQFTIGKDVIQQ